MSIRKSGLRVARVVPLRSEMPSSSAGPVWQSLRHLLGSLPSRRLWVVAGDFNTNLRVSAKHVGARASAYMQKSHPDTKELMDIIQDLQLVHLNSWTRRATATFRSAQGNTLIDHAFVRADQRDRAVQEPCREGRALIPEPSPFDKKPLTGFRKKKSRHRCGRQPFSCCETSTKHFPPTRRYIPPSRPHLARLPLLLPLLPETPCRL